MTQLECDVILFDLDGVLIDSTVCITRHWHQWAQYHGLDPDRVMQVAHGMRTIDTIRLIAPHLSAEEEARRFTENEVPDNEGVVAIAGAAQLLTSLRPEDWAIVTSGNRELATARLRHAGLPVPDILVSADDVTQGKPAPEPYLLAAHRVSVVPDRCLVIEDSPAGIKAARSAKMQVVGVATTHSFQELLKATIVIASLSALHVTDGAGDQHGLTIQVEEEVNSARS